MKEEKNVTSSNVIEHQEPPHTSELFSAEILANVSHELRSPLASIKGYAGMLLRHEQRISPEERHELLLAIQEASNRLAHTLDRFLELSQLESGAIVLVPTVVNIPELAQEAIIVARERGRQLQPVQPKEGETNTPERHTLSLRIEGLLELETLCVWGDQQRLLEALDSLLENAILYSPEGGNIDVTIKPAPPPVAHRTIANAMGVKLVQAKGKSEGGGHKKRKLQRGLQITIQDQGIGIPKEHLEKIFDRFHRVDIRLVREISGLGLGLAICKCIVQLHGGTVWADSTPGKGSAFHVWLPLYDEQMKDEALWQERKSLY